MGELTSLGNRTFARVRDFEVDPRRASGPSADRALPEEPRKSAWASGRGRRRIGWSGRVASVALVVAGDLVLVADVLAPAVNADVLGPAVIVACVLV